ncbi:Hpt domain-containing protein [bacterium]|nr:Hpt domain-containing protein [bacterium]
MTVKELYNEIGGNYNNALSRLMKDRLIEKFALKFLQDGTFNKLSESVQKEDWTEAFLDAHTLKGVAMNLAFDKLGESASALTDALRPENVGNMNAADIKELFGTVASDYSRTVGGINKYQSEL